jgi:hypothetical protein
MRSLHEWGEQYATVNSAQLSDVQSQIERTKNIGHSLNSAPSIDQFSGVKVIKGLPDRRLQSFFSTERPARAVKARQ